ncbi:hypothetical protein JOD43_002834 [Pullulanibacillus pueri]|uniref:DEAD/DEAH box helicase n=1 Tax=Pullulanibacillus pueri TaxID=1437324 RepID=A0A8J3EMZ6_9BACL|nr:Z1 domain-containing protein [Pullulanibacillus pueri]MBM7682655.1 hypothetical protein [Pullulanibacillus pueri]GGH82668.1 DEAD/DEAH box helicase [Pullulanibacillus pueri]
MNTVATKINTDGLIYRRLVLHNHYSPEQQMCIERTVNKLLQHSTSADRPGMLLGRIQSGKTRTFIGVAALGFDNHYDMTIVLTKGTRALSQQTYERLNKEFRSLREDDVVQVFDIMTLPDNLINYELDQKLIFVVKKEMNNLQRLRAALFETYPQLAEKRILIIDDEADFASFGFTKTKAEIIEINRIAGHIDDLRKNLKQVDFLQVTATPYSLYLQPEAYTFRHSDRTFKPIRPAFTELVPVGKGYIGGEYYFKESEEDRSLASFLYEPIALDELVVLKKEDRRRFKIEQALSSQKIHSLRQAIVNFMVGGIIRRWQDEKQNKRPRKYSFIIHTEQAKASHGWQEAVILSLKAQLVSALDQEPLILDSLVRQAYENIRRSLKRVNGDVPKYEEVKYHVYYAIGHDHLMITKVNSENDMNQLLDETGELRLRAPLNIFIGGQILDRGITIGNLIGFYYGRNPRRFQQDTVLQHSRMFGYRPLEDLAVTRFYTTLEIYEVMKTIHEFDTALRNAFERGGQEGGVVFIQKDASNHIIPCSPNKLILSTTTTLKPFKRLLPVGFQTGYKTYIAKTIQALDRSILQHRVDQPFLLDVTEATRIIETIKTTFDDEAAKPWSAQTFISTMEYLATLGKGKEAGKVWCIVKTDRQMARVRKNGRWEDAPDTPRGKDSELTLAREVAQYIPALILLRQNGEEDKGWRDTPFWWPVLVTPRHTPTTIFAES